MTNSSVLTNLIDPPSQRAMYKYDDADDWIVEEEKEVYSISVKHKGFVYMPREGWMNVLPMHFIYKYKKDPYGLLLRRKARLVVGGHRQQHEVDYFETYAATTMMESVRYYLAVAASVAAKIAKFDIETFFLYAKPDVDIYVEQPPGHQIIPEGAKNGSKHTDYVIQLQVALYGCKQSPMLANQDVTSFFRGIGLLPTRTDSQVFVSGTFPKSFVIVLLFVDDGLCIYNDDQRYKKLIADMKKKYTLKEELNPKDFLSLEIEYHDTYLKLHQTGYVKQLLNDFKMDNCNSVPTPITESLVKVITETPNSLTNVSNTNDFPMLTLCGRLLWLTRLSRFDICFATNFLCRYMAVANKLDKLLPIAKRVLRYLKGAAEVGLIYPIMKQTDLIVSGVVDSDFAGDTTKKSTYCRYTYLDRCLINFTTKLQKTVATSTCNAEFNGIAEAMTDVIYYRACTAELRGKFWPKELSPFTINYPMCDCPRAKEMLKADNKPEPPPSVIKNDNAGAVAAIAKAGATAKGTKNEVAKLAFVQKCVELGIARLEHQPGADIVTDMGTKGVPPAAFAKKLQDAQPSEEEFKTARLMHLTVEQDTSDVETFNTHQPLPGDPGYDSDQGLKVQFELDGDLSDDSIVSKTDPEYVKANFSYDSQDQEPYLAPRYVDKEDLTESMFDDSVERKEKLNAQQYAVRLAYKEMLNLPDKVYRYPNSRLMMVRDQEGAHRRRVLNGTFAQSAAEEERVFCIIWCLTNEYYDSTHLMALGVVIIYDFGDANPLRVVINVPRTMGTTLAEFVERYVGTMFNQPLSKFYISLNGKRFSPYRLYSCAFALIDHDEVTITPKELGLMGGGRHQKTCSVLSELQIDSSDEEEKLPREFPTVTQPSSRTVSTTTTITTTRAPRHKDSKRTVSARYKQLAVEPRKPNTVCWSPELDRSSTSSAAATPMVITANVSSELPFVASYRDEDPDYSVTFNDFSRSNSESSSTIASSSQDSNGPVEAVTDDQRRAFKLFGARCRNEVNKLHQKLTSYNKKMAIYHKQCERLLQIEKTANDFSTPSVRTMDNKMESLANRIAGLPQVEGEESCAARRAKDVLLEVTDFLAEDYNVSFTASFCIALGAISIPVSYTHLRAHET